MAVMSADIDGIMRDLKRISYAFLPEIHFVNYFLPMFSLQEDNPKKLQEWIAIAGSPFKEVAIKNVEGKDIFVVPPILSNSNIDPSKIDGASFGHIMASYAQYNRQSPALGRKYLERTLGAKAEAVGTVREEDSATKVWAKIFDRYGLKVEGFNTAVVEGDFKGIDTTSKRPRDEDFDFNPL